MRSGHTRGLAGVLLMPLVWALFWMPGASAAGGSEVEPNDTQATATPLDIGLTKGLAGTLTGPDDVDYFAFVPDLPGAYVVEVYDADPALASVHAFLEDEVDWHCCYTASLGDYTVADRGRVIDAVPGARYTARVWAPESLAGGSYRIRVLRSHDNGGPERDSSGEPDGAPDIAHRPPLGEWVRGEIHKVPEGVLSIQSDVDFYRFQGEPYLNYTFRVRSETNKMALVPDLRVGALWDAPVGSGWVQGDSRGELNLIQVKGGSPGSYEICVEGPGVSCSSGVLRIAGADRHETAALTSATMPADAKVAIIAASGAFPDALAGSALAARLGGPVLLVPPTGIPASVDQELRRLKPRIILVIGGPAAVSDGTFSAMGAYATANHPGEVVRLAGADRYETAAKVAAYSGTTDVIYLATGEDFPDALSGAALAGMTDGVIILTQRNKLSSAARERIYYMAPKRIVVLGGEGRVSDDLLSSIQVQGPTEIVRIAGGDRYETSAKIAAEFPANVGEAYVATGRSFPDALAGAARAAWSHAPVLLVPGTQLPAPIGTQLTRLRPEAIMVLGGTAAVSADVERRLGAYVR